MTGWQRDGFATVTPYLLVEGAIDLLDFIEDAFGGEVVVRQTRPDGTLTHAEVRIGDSMVMVGEATDDFGTAPASLYLYVPDCNETFAAALQAGGTIVMEPTTLRSVGERYGGVTDPCGNLWWIATHLPDIDVEAEQRRLDAAEPPDDPSE